MLCTKFRRIGLNNFVGAYVIMSLTYIILDDGVIQRHVYFDVTPLVIHGELPATNKTRSGHVTKVHFTRD